MMIIIIIMMMIIIIIIITKIRVEVKDCQVANQSTMQTRKQH